MNWEYFVQNRELAIACLVAGTVFGVILPLILNRLKAAWDAVWNGFTGVLSFVFSTSYGCWLVMSLQFALEIFLLQQWIFGYNHANGGGGFYDSYAYLPLTVTIPAFFGNIAFFVATGCRLAETTEKEKNKR